MHRFVILGLWLGLGMVSTPAQAEGDFLTYHPVSARLGLGMTAGPNTFLLAGSVEGHVDPFFSAGPMLQMGLSSATKLYITTLGGRYTLPWYALERVKTSLHGGAGMIVRDFQGFRFTDFVFTTGLDVDFFVIKNLTAGLGGILNVTGNRNERFVHSILATAAYHF